MKFYEISFKVCLFNFKTMECQYCHRILSSKSSLNNHQKTAKYCIALRGNEKEVKQYPCSNCGKTFIRQSALESHIKTCKIAKQTHVAELEDTIKNQEQVIVELKQQLCKSEERNKLLSEQVEYLRGYNEKVTSQPTTNVTNKTTNIQNIVNNLTVFDKTPEDINRIFQERFDKNYLIQGQKGVAKFTKIHVLEHSAGRPPVYIITDRSRFVAKYKTPSGEIVTDHGMWDLTRKVQPSAKRKSWQIVQNEVENPEMNEMLLDPCIKISSMESKNTAFRQELVASLQPCLTDDSELEISNTNSASL